jgi:WD40 repeat protein
MKRFILLALLTLSLGSIRQQQATQARQPASKSDVLLIDWSPDGSHVALSAADGIRLYDSNFQPTGFFPYTVDQNSRDYITPFGFWSPDGTRLTAGSVILDAKTLQPIVTTKASVPLIQWSPDGKYISTLSLDGLNIERYNAQIGNLEDTISAISSSGTQSSGVPIPNPDGSRFVLNGGDAIEVVDAANKTLARYQYPYRINVLRLSPDGRRIAYQSTQTVPISTPGSLPKAGTNEWGTLVYTFIIDAATGKTLMQSEPLNTLPAGLTWSPDGTQLAGNLALRAVVIWDTATGKVIDTYSLPAGKGVTLFTYSPFSGRLTLGIQDLSVSGITVNTTGMPVSTFNQVFLDGTIQVIVPAPSLEKLKTIAERCKVQPAVQQMLTAQIQSKQLPTFIQQVSALTDTQILPGCKADLLAVAQALQAK